MKNIQVLLIGLLLSGLPVATCFAQEKGGSDLPPAIRPTEAPDIIYPNSVNEEADNPAVAPLPNQQVQPIARPLDNDELLPENQPLNLHQGTNAPLDVTRPFEAPSQPSIDRLYHNRIEVDQYAPVVPQVPSSSPPPGSMQPETAPNRPGTIGGTAK